MTAEREEFLKKVNEVNEKYSPVLKKYGLLSNDGQVLHKRVRSARDLNITDYKTKLLELLIEECGEEQLKPDLAAVDIFRGRRFEAEIIAEYSVYLKKHKLLSADGKKLDGQISSIREDWGNPFKFKIKLLKMLINYGEEQLQDELDAMGGKEGEKLRREERAKEERLKETVLEVAERNIEVELEEKIKALREKYMPIVEDFKELEIFIKTQVEIGALSQEEGDKKQKEAQKHAEQKLSKVYESREQAVRP